MGRWILSGAGLVVLSLSFGLSNQGFAEERYVVKQGDSLYGISKAFGMSVQVLKTANGLKGDALRLKQVLLIPARGTEKRTKETVKKPADGIAKKHVLSREPIHPSTSSGRTVEGPAVDKETIPYVVQKGDNLYAISKKFGISIEEVKTLNHLQSTALKVGQSLRLSKVSREEVEDFEEAGDPEELAIEAVPEKDAEKPETTPAVGKWSGSEERSLFVTVAKNFLGAPYRLGGSTLKGLDCSAFVKKIYQIFSVDLPRTAREQCRFGKGVGKNDLEAGDLVFFQTRQANGTHVGIYIGNNEFVHASSRNREVKVDSLDAPYFNKRFLRGVRVKELERES
jgi:peptidoglycan DL-endopeptidase LytE